MSHATADLEYFQCDMCQTYMHRDIYCNHRRECKGKDSQEIRKADVIRISKVLDDETRLRAKQVATCAADGGSAGVCSQPSCAATSTPASRFAVAPKAILTTTNLDKAQKQQSLAVLRALETSSVAPAIARVKGSEASWQKEGSAPVSNASEKKLLTTDDIDDFLNS